MNDIRLAHKITLHYARDIYGLTEDDLKGLPIEHKQNHILLDSLGRGAGGLVTAEERDGLRAHGFSDRFIDELAGVDGKKALYARIKWLTNNAPQKIFGKIPKMRGEIIQELGEMGVLGSRAVPVLIEILGSEFSEKNRLTQVAAAVALGKIGDGRGVKALARAFASWPPETLNAVGSALVSLCGSFPQDEIESTVIPVLVERLDTSTAWRARYESARALGRLGKKAALAGDELVLALNDSEGWVRQEAAWALGKIGSDSPQIISALVGILREWPAEQRMVAVEALVSLGKPAYSSLILLLDQEPSYVRQSVIKIIARSDEPLEGGAIKKMVMALKDPDPQVQQEAEQALVTLGAQAFPHLVEALGSVDERFREQVMRIIRAQAETGLVEAVAQLLDLLETHPGKGVRADAARLLGELGIREAVDPILTAMRREKIEVSVAGETLRLLMPESIPPVVAFLKEEGMRDKGVAILLMFGNPALDYLAKAMIAGSDSERNLYTDVLILFGERVLPVGLPLATHADSGVRDQGIKILVGIGAVDLLLSLLQDRQWQDYHSSYAFALGTIGLPAVPFLLQALADPSFSEIHPRLVEILVAIGQPAVPDLEKSAGDYNQTLSQHAQEALQQIRGEDHGP